jgi:hypothetical protein
MGLEFDMGPTDAVALQVGDREHRLCPSLLPRPPRRRGDP